MCTADSSVQPKDPNDDESVSVAGVLPVVAPLSAVEEPPPLVPLATVTLVGATRYATIAEGIALSTAMWASTDTASCGKPSPAELDSRHEDVTSRQRQQGGTEGKRRVSSESAGE
jgi:hypothetical protein